MKKLIYNSPIMEIDKFKYTDSLLTAGLSDPDGWEGSSGTDTGPVNPNSILGG